MTGTEPRACRARVERVADLTPDVRETEWGPLEPPSLPYEAGQFIALAFRNSKGETESRAFSIASEPEDGRLRLVAKLVAGGLASDFFRSLKVGGEVSFRAPFGRFVLCGEKGRPLLFVGTGTGISPLRAMVRHLLLHERSSRPMTLLFGVRHERDLFWIDEFRSLAGAHSNFRFVTTLSQPGASWTGGRGRVTEHLAREVPDPKSVDAYLCGGSTMIAEVSKWLVDRGLDRRHAHQERFY